MKKTQREEMRRGKAIDAAKVERIVGRRIVKAESNAAWEEDGEYGCWMHAWRLTLDDGTTLTFMTEEHPIGAEYGTDICVYPSIAEASA
jgi:hypothetical protein